MGAMARRWQRLRAQYGAPVADGFAVLFSIVGTIAATESNPRWVDLPRWVIAVTGAAGTVLLWWRRRHPVRLTLGSAVLFLFSHNPVPLLYGLYSAAVARRDRVLVAIVVAGGVAFAVPELMRIERFNLGIVISAMMQAIAVAAIGAYVGARRDLVASLRERAERAEEERELRADQAKASERARIAREMHDVLAHKVSLIALHAGALEVNADAGSDRVEEAASLIRTTAHQTLEELREVLGVLRSEAGAEGSDLVPTATVADIARLVDASRTAGVTVELVDELPELPDATARAVYRMVQEGLTNVHKHARGAATVVTITGSESDGVIVAVVNRAPVAAGLLGEQLPGSGSGLVGLGERIRLLGGTFDSGAEPGGGWAMRAWLPWAGAPAEPVASA